MSGLLPVGQGQLLGGERHRSTRVVPVEVALQQEVGRRAGPDAAERIAAIEDDEVLREREGAMLFGAAALELVEVREGEDVIPDHVILAVVLVVAAVGRVVADVAFHRDAGAAFVVVETPAPVAEATDVVDVVVADGGPFGRSERIDPAHIAEHAFAEMVKVVVFDAVTLGGAGRIAPTPAHGDGRIE